MAKIGVVIPTIRPEIFNEWHYQWRELFDKYAVELYVVEDSESKSDFPVKNHYCRSDFPPFIPEHTGSCRSLGFLKAYQDKCSWIVTLDDDCFPVEDIFAHYAFGFSRTYPVSDYFDIGHVFGLNEFMRGYPFADREVARPILQYGGWDNVPDLDAITQLKYGKPQGYHFDRRVYAIPQGNAFTGCIMNVAIKREAIPMMYQLIMGIDNVGYDRWDDIWSGLFAKKICDHLRLPILVNGWASIIHTRASDSLENLRKETDGYHLNERMWENLKTVRLTGANVLTCYTELTAQLKPHWFGPKGSLIIKGMEQWIQALQSA